MALCVAHKVIQPTKRKMRNNGLRAEDKRCQACAARVMALCRRDARCLIRKLFTGRLCALRHLVGMSGALQFKHAPANGGHRDRAHHPGHFSGYSAADRRVSFLRRTVAGTSPSPRHAAYACTAEADRLAASVAPLARTSLTRHADASSRRFPLLFCVLHCTKRAAILKWRPFEQENPCAN
jgi:hypothetical protein